MAINVKVYKFLLTRYVFNIQYIMQYGEGYVYLTTFYGFWLPLFSLICCTWRKPPIWPVTNRRQTVSHYSVIYLIIKSLRQAPNIGQEMLTILKYIIAIFVMKVVLFHHCYLLSRRTYFELGTLYLIR